MKISRKFRKDENGMNPLANPAFLLLIVVVAVFVVGINYLNITHNGVITEKTTIDGALGIKYIFQIDGDTRVVVNEETYGLYEIGDNFTYDNGDMTGG